MPSFAYNELSAVANEKDFPFLTSRHVRRNDHHPDIAFIWHHGGILLNAETRLILWLLAVAPVRALMSLENIHPGVILADIASIRQMLFCCADQQRQCVVPCRLRKALAGALTERAFHL